VATASGTSMPDNGARPGPLDDDRLLEVLEEDECLELLAGAVVGRLAFTEDAMPAIQPVSFGILDGEVLIPTRPGSKVAAASRGAVVAFEVDDVDAVERTGWNVTVIGPSRVVTDPAVIRSFDRRGIRPWVPTAEHCYIAVRITLVRGRRLRQASAGVRRGGDGDGLLGSSGSPV
jgi:uncharacterized protein